MESKGTVYLDESGDFGWKFDLPYRRGGSSRYLTIAAVLLPSERSYLPAKCVRAIYSKYKWSTNKEKKWKDMKNAQKLSFGEECIDIKSKFPGISMHSVTVYKPKVPVYVRENSNCLYNYMINKMLIKPMKEYDQIQFLPDPRALKLQSRNSLAEYLQTNLWFEQNAQTVLEEKLISSDQCKGIQFADMLSGTVQQNFEDGVSNTFNMIENLIDVNKLYFPQAQVADNKQSREVYYEQT